MEEQVFDRLLEDGLLALEYIRTGEDEEAQALLDMVEEAKMRGFEIAAEALGLTNAEFNASIQNGSTEMRSVGLA